MLNEKGRWREKVFRQNTIFYKISGYTFSYFTSCRPMGRFFSSVYMTNMPSIEISCKREINFTNFTHLLPKWVKRDEFNNESNEPFTISSNIWLECSTFLILDNNYLRLLYTYHNHQKRLPDLKPRILFIINFLY